MAGLLPPGSAARPPKLYSFIFFTHISCVLCRPALGAREVLPNWALEARGPNPKYVSRYSIQPKKKRSYDSASASIRLAASLPCPRLPCPSADATLTPVRVSDSRASDPVRLRNLRESRLQCECERSPAGGTHFHYSLTTSVPAPSLPYMEVRIKKQALSG
jgi:hypothetical protein